MDNENIRTKVFIDKNDKPILRGSVYFIDIPEDKTFFNNSVEQGTRPCVVVSSQKGCDTSSIVMVCPITTRIKKHSCNVDISYLCAGKPSQVLCNQIITVPKSSLIRYKGYVSNREMLRVNDAIRLSLGI